MLRHPGSQPLAGRTQGFLSQLVGKIRHVDAHRTGSGAKAVSGTGVHSRVFIGLLKGFIRLSGGFSAGYFPLHGNASAGAEGETAGNAVHLAETALYALVKGRIWQQGSGFQMLQVAFPVFVEDDSGVQDTLGVQQGFDAFHQAESLFSPLRFHKGSHVAAGAVFCFQGAVVLVYNQLHHVPDHGIVSFNIGPCFKCLIDNEMEVSF